MADGMHLARFSNFYICDELLLRQAFEAHLVAAVTSHLQMSSSSVAVQGSMRKYSNRLEIPQKLF